ncbi:aspartate/glutamate racemase family protein [Clostridium sp. Cult2]|uniref:aspartate/glutamate racemase family protein n=1 Tax=Clostridium sp. Cult2 TaxID=2079003 RepID=UPI001F02D538|nr:amino acid racemase [Clostridium sp. Cult2]MCF6465836.1 aspartate racemase [Clostridium sp. Cult2]
MYKVGVLGGMGPLATMDLCNKIIYYTDAHKDNDHIHLIIDNNTEIPDRTEYILGRGEDPLKYLIKSAVTLENMGANFIIIPCNTAHYFYDNLCKFIGIPIINMIEETAKTIKDKYVGINKIILLSTEGTYKSKIYSKIFQKYDLEIISPEAEERKYVTKLIYNIKEGVLDSNISDFKKMINGLLRNNHVPIILGCTELPVAFERYRILDWDLIDPTKILAIKAINAAGGRVKDLNSNDLKFMKN